MEARLLVPLKKTLDAEKNRSRNKKRLWDACLRELYSLAAQHGQATGKWLLYPDADGVDAAWSNVARSTMAGQLGCSAKAASPLFMKSNKSDGGVTKKAATAAAQARAAAAAATVPAKPAAKPATKPATKPAKPANSAVSLSFDEWDELDHKSNRNTGEAAKKKQKTNGP
jgi:hypothetical protein